MYFTGKMHMKRGHLFSLWEKRLKWDKGENFYFLSFFSLVSAFSQKTRHKMCLRVCVCVCVCVWVSEWVSVWVCLFVMWVSVFIRVRHVLKVWICSAEEFIELYGKVEAVIRNCLLRWSGRLFEVTGTHLFDQCFCFKHIRLFFCAPGGAFFRWYLFVLLYLYVSGIQV